MEPRSYPPLPVPLLGASLARFTHAQGAPAEHILLAGQLLLGYRAEAFTFSVLFIHDCAVALHVPYLPTTPYTPDVSTGASRFRAALIWQVFPAARQPNHHFFIGDNGWTLALTDCPRSHIDLLAGYPRRQHVHPHVPGRLRYDTTADAYHGTVRRVSACAFETVLEAWVQAGIDPDQALEALLDEAAWVSDMAAESGP